MQNELVPAGEADELTAEDGCRRWDLAVRLLDPEPPVAPDEWALEPLSSTDPWTKL